MLCMLLRKHLCGGKILSIEQQGLDRIIKITVRSSNELGDEVLLTLVAEIMGRYSNIILLDDKGTIIDALRRVDENSSRVRRVLPGLKYEAPPAQDKLDILTDDIEKSKQEFLKAPNRLQTLSKPRLWAFRRLCAANMKTAPPLSRSSIMRKIRALTLS